MPAWVTQWLALSVCWSLRSPLQRRPAGCELLHLYSNLRCHRHWAAEGDPCATPCVRQGFADRPSFPLYLSRSMSQGGEWETAVWPQERASAGLHCQRFCMCVGTMRVLTCGHTGGWPVAATILCLHVGIPEETGGSSSGLLRIFGLGRDARSKCNLTDPQGLRVCSV